jgi:putative hydrolase of the HAD superfamily
VHTDPGRTLAVTFDFGQTLAELDTGMLARRLAERDLTVTSAALDGAVPAAWAAYDRAVLAGLGGHPWKILMDALLAGAGVAAARRPGVVDWLWTEQPARNLWRRPIPGMIDVARALVARGVPVGIVSNSEGRLAELAAELGWASDFACIADSGRLGVEKPERAIFDWAAQALGVAVDAIVHVGDSWAADVLGALGAGARAVWFSPGGAAAPQAPAAAAERLRIARSPAGLAAALRDFGAPL